MNIAPEATLEEVESIVTQPGLSIRGMVLTLKFSDWKVAERLPQYIERVRGWRDEISAHRLEVIEPLHGDWSATSGYELATQVRADARLTDIPIVMITSRVGEKHRARAIEIGVNDYLGKPYQENQLLDAIEPLVQARRRKVS